MGYQSQREKVKEFFEQRILPQMKLKYWQTIDYYKTVGNIQAETGASESMVVDVISALIKSGKLAEDRQLCLSPSEIEVIRHSINEQTHKDLKGVGLE